MIYLRLQDETVLEFDLDSGIFHSDNPAKLPVGLRDNLMFDDDSRKAFMKNYDSVMAFLTTRSLNIKRENAKKILNALHISQSSDYDTVLKTMIMCKALSVTDDYWITQNQNEKWEDVNLRENPLHTTIAQIALSGVTLTVTGKIHTPELTGQGAYAKAWYRENGKLYLYKAGTAGNCEAQVEASVSKILDATNTPHVEYTLDKKEGLKVSKCLNMCSDEVSIVPAEAVQRWCNRTGRNFDDFVTKLDPENYYKMMVVDYLIANSDRHGQNWGFYMNNKTGELMGLHPLYDHNNAFDEQEMKLPGGGDSLIMEGKTKEEAAKYAMKRCNFKITADLTRNAFCCMKHYDYFKEKAESRRRKI